MANFAIDVLALNGTFEPNDKTTHVVSSWNIPGGDDYSQASVVNFFFPTESDANEFARIWEKPPEMAMVLTYRQYLEIKKSVSESLKHIAGTSHL